MQPTDPRPKHAAWRMALWVILIGGVAALIAGWLFFRSHVFSPRRMTQLGQWLSDSAARPEWSIHAGERCGGPFLMPTDGYIGFLWGDSFRIGHHHQGLDIFGGGGLGQTPVYAAYSGYLTRREDWKASVILRIPDDPLQPGRQIWTYYTHMAGPQGDSYISADFPPGSSEVWVEAGTLLGYQGNYSGTPGNPTGVHLHFSIVQDDGQGGFLNELKIENTLDPSPYLGLRLNAWDNRDEIPVCGG